MQRSFLCELLNLEEEHQDYLSILEEGQCIARVNSVKRPFLLWVPHIQRHWIKRGDVNRKNKLILKNLKEPNIISLKENEKSNRKISQNNQKIQNEEEDITEYARMKYSIDNLFVDDENEKEDFNPNNYRKCNECFSIIETKHKSCPYCGSYLS